MLTPGRHLCLLSRTDGFALCHNCTRLMAPPTTRDTLANFRLHFNVHRKVPCNFCFRKFLNASSMEEHVKETHKASKLPQYHCKQDSCTKQFGTQIESFRHLRSEHRNLFKYRCKKCKNSFSTVQELFRHHKLHDKNHLPFEAKWSCSRFGDLQQLESADGTHEDPHRKHLQM